MWDYDKLFAEGNILGIKNLYTKQVLNSVVDTYSYDYWFDDYKNNELSSKNCKVDVDYGVGHGYTTDFEIQYIIRLDEHGNVVEKLFDRETDMPKPMPELETGMFVRVYNTYRKEGILALIYDNRVIYQDGKWDEIYDLTEDVVMEVYSDKALCFNNCQSPYLIWQNPLSNKTN